MPRYSISVKPELVRRLSGVEEEEDDDDDVFIPAGPQQYRWNPAANCLQLQQKDSEPPPSAILALVPENVKEVRPLTPAQQTSKALSVRWEALNTTKYNEERPGISLEHVKIAALRYLVLDGNIPDSFISLVDKPITMEFLSHCIMYFKIYFAMVRVMGLDIYTDKDEYRIIPHERLDRLRTILKKVRRKMSRCYYNILLRTDEMRSKSNAGVYNATKNVAQNDCERYELLYMYIIQGICITLRFIKTELVEMECGRLFRTEIFNQYFHRLEHRKNKHRYRLYKILALIDPNVTKERKPIFTRYRKFARSPLLRETMAVANYIEEAEITQEDWDYLRLFDLDNYSIIGANVDLFDEMLRDLKSTKTVSSMVDKKLKQVLKQVNEGRKKMKKLGMSKKAMDDGKQNNWQ